MVIYYNAKGTIEMVEYDTMEPFMMNVENLEKVKKHYSNQGLYFVYLEDNIKGSIMDYKVIKDSKDKFIRLEKKDVIE